MTSLLQPTLSTSILRINYLNKFNTAKWARTSSLVVTNSHLHACLVLDDKTVHFERSVPSYIPAELNDGRGGYVLMRALQQLVRSHNAFGGPMTRHLTDKEFEFETHNRVMVSSAKERYHVTLMAT